MDPKHAKEIFVSGHTGTSLAEIYLLTATLISGYLLRCVLVVCVPCVRCASTAFSFAVEYTAIILPGILAFTILSDYTVFMITFMLLSSCAVGVFSVLRNNHRLNQVYQRLSEAPYPDKLPCVTLSRTYVTLITAIAILAVDFIIYPRRLAKAETYGTGLMDVGVGAFLMAHGLTSPEARQKNANRRYPSYIKMFLSTVRQVAPLLVIGFLRLLAVKSTDYQEHVTEYGVHWNFFFTIAVVRLLSSLLHPVLNSSPHLYGAGSLLTGLTYQLFLSRFGLRDYVLLGPHGDGSRPTFISANREGILSCIGYLAIYLGYIEIGRWLFKPRNCLSQYIPVLLQLVCLSGVFYLATVGSAAAIEPVSRRIVNLAYIWWILSYGTFILSIFLMIDMIVFALAISTHTPLPSPYTPHSGSTHTLHSPSSSHDKHSDTVCPSPTPKVCIISAVDSNQLAFFLLANLLTGFVNFAVDTLNTGTLASLSILVLYMGVLSGVFVVLHTFQIRIKF